MPRQCPACGNLNDDSLGFCSKCGEPVDPNVRLVIDVQNYQKPQPQKPVRSRDDDEFVYHPLSQKKKQEKKSSLPWILLGVAVVAVVLWLIL